MYLRNKRTGHTIYLAKYYPSTGWYVNKDAQDLYDDMGETFVVAHEDETQPRPDMMWGEEWELWYEPWPTPDSPIR